VKCEHVQELVSACLDEGRTLGREVRQHLDGCPACAAFERDWRRLDALLVAGHADAPPAAARRRFAWIVAGCGLLAASVLLAVFASQPWGGTPSRPGANPFAGSLLAIDPDVLDLTDRAIRAVRASAADSYPEELACVVAEARSAADFLLSYFPSPEVLARSSAAASQATPREEAEVDCFPSGQGGRQCDPVRPQGL